MEPLSVYIPIDRRVAMAQGRTLPERSDGTALLADISGFTPLTEALTRLHGPQRGAEETTRILNEVYDALVAEAHLYGGSVIGFSGDAFTCWFDRDDGQRATTSALAMQQAAARFTSIAVGASTPFSLAVKVAIAAGPVRRFRVGDPQVQYLDTLAGATLDHLAAAEQRAERGEIVLDAAAAEQLGGRASVSAWRAAANGDGSAASNVAVVGGLSARAAPAPWCEPAANAFPEEEIRPWLLAPVYERLRGGHDAYLAELRPAVALFIRFSGLDYDRDESSGEKLDAYIRWVQGLLRRYEGALIDITIGDKGSYLYAAFGAPIAHPDDAVRAVAAALDIRAMPAHLDFISPPQMGISRGRMRTGAYGGTARRTYGVLGDEVNLAARLMQRAAPGQIIVSQRVADAASRRFRFRALGEVRVKGKLLPVPVCEAAGQDAASQEANASGVAHRPGAVMIGRIQERAQLGEQLQALTHRSGGATVIEGDAGIGKSQLVIDLLEQAQALGIASYTGAGDAIESSSSYLAWRSIFSHLLELPAQTANAEERRTHVMRQLQSDPELQRMAPLLNAVLPLDFPENELTAQMSGQVRADNLAGLLMGILQRAAEARPLLAILEDAHWLDSASWALAQRVASDAQAMLLVIASRPQSDPKPPEYQRIISRPGTRMLRLGPLPPDNITALVCQRLGVRTLPDPVAILVRTKAEGHPFFSEELAYAIRDAGLIDITDGECHVKQNADLSAATFPDTVQGVITSRIDHLAASQQLTLKVASVIGRVFRYRILRDTYPVVADRPRIAEQLNMLERLDLTPLETPEPDLSYGFKHSITQEVAYDLMLFAQRRELHRSMAEWYEQAHTGDLAAYYPLLAHHWGKAEIPAKAMHYLEKAGEQALGRYQNREAVTFFAELLRLDAETAAPSGPAAPAVQRARWARQLAEAYYGLGEVPKSRQQLRRALALLDKPEPRTTPKLVQNVLIQLAVQEFHRRLRGKFKGRAAQNDEALVEAVRAYDKVSLACFYSGEVLAATNAIFSTINLAEAARNQAELVEELARAYANVGAAYAGAFRLYALAETYFEKAWSIACDSGHLPAMGWTRHVDGLTKMVAGFWEKADERVRQAAEIYTQLGDHRRWEETSFILSASYYFQAQFVQSRQLAVEGYASARRRADAQSQAISLAQQSLSELALGRDRAALALLVTADGLMADSDSHAERVFAGGLLALARARQGDRKQALHVAEQTSALIAKAPESYIALEGYAALTEGCLLLVETAAPGSREREHLLSLAHQAYDSMRKTSHKTSPAHGPRVLLYAGCLAASAGNRRGAQRAWRQCLQRAAALRMPYDEGKAQFELARSAAASERPLHRARAIEIFKTIGAAHDLACAEQLSL